MILGKKDKAFVETLKEERLDALKRVEVLENRLIGLVRSRKDDIDLLLSNTGLDLTDLAYLCNKPITELKKIYSGEIKLSDEDFYKLICKMFRELLRMSK